MKKVWNNIIHSAWRWHSAESVVPYSFYSRIEKFISAETLENLKTFKLKICYTPIDNMIQLSNPRQQLFSLTMLLSCRSLKVLLYHGRNLHRISPTYLLCGTGSVTFSCIRRFLARILFLYSFNARISRNAEFGFPAQATRG